MNNIEEFTGEIVVGVFNTMRVGDYVRTKKGEIGKIIDYIDEPTDYYFNCYVTTFKNFTNKYITEYDNNIKSSPNIIDLLEVGDYVNGWRVNSVEKEEDGTLLKIGTITSFVSKNETEPYLTQDYDEVDKMCKLKSIVTKEQFESMEYKVGEY